MTNERRGELCAALTTVLDSQEIFEEFENANYHSAWEFLGETRDELEQGYAIGEERWADDEEPA